MTTDYYLRINELKNAIYCPRISFYTLCMGIDRETGASRMGIAAEADVKAKMKRRKQALHAVVQGERLFNVPLTSHTYQLVGNLDEMVVTADGLYLVDYKDTDKDFGYWRVQMTAYRVCVEEQDDRPVLGCYVYSIPGKTYHPVKSTQRDEDKLRDLIAQMNTMIQSEVCPPPTAQSGKCVSCQYARFCNDVF